MGKESGDAFAAKPRLSFNSSYQLFEWCVAKRENFCSFPFKCHKGGAGFLH